MSNKESRSLSTLPPEVALAPKVTEEERESRRIAPISSLDFYSEDEQSRQNSLREMFLVLLRQHRVFLGVFLVALLLGLLLSSRSKPVYRSTSNLLVNTSSAGVEKELPVLSDLLSAGSSRSLDTQLEILKSDTVMKKALDRLSAPEREVTKKYLEVDVTPLRKSDIMAVSVTTHSPLVSTRLANAIAQEYIDQSQAKNLEQLRSAANYVQQQLQTVGAQLNKAQNQLADYKRRNGTIDISTEAETRVKQLAAAEDSLREAQAQVRSSQSQLERSQTALTRLAPSQVVPNVIVPKAATQALKAELTRLELEKLALSEDFVNSSPEIQGVNEKIREVKGRLQEQSQTEISSWQRIPNEDYQGLVAGIGQARSQLWAQQARAQALENSVAQIRSRLAQLPDKELELTRLNSQTGLHQQTFQMLNEKYQSLRISEKARVSNASITSEASVPTRPIGMGRLQSLIVTVFLSLMLALTAVLLIERLDDRIHSDRDAELAARLPILGHVPLVKGSTERRLPLANDTQTSHLLESFRVLRTNIAFSSPDQSAEVIMITSSHASEGKSTTAANLAITMALNGKKVILVDADLRRPNVHRLLDLPNNQGFSDVIVGQCTLADAIRKTDLENLDALTSGNMPPNPPDLLDSQSSRNSILSLRQQYDMVIIDTPPLLSLADSRVVSTMCDAALLVVSYEDVTRQEVARTSALLTQTGIHVMGIVLTKVPQTPLSYYSYEYRSLATYTNDK